MMPKMDRKKSRWIFSFFLLLAAPLFGKEEPSISFWEYHPLRIEANLIRIGKASVDSDEHGHLFFRKNTVFTTMLVPISKTSYLFPRVGWNNFTLNWNKNPKFNETHFYYAQFGLMFYTIGLEKWRWILRADYNLDLEHFNRPSYYGLFSALVWGAYELHKKWHYHIGATGYLGLEGDVIYPILGLDFSPNKYWTFEAIFPLTYSIQYKLNKSWRFSIKGRPLKERFRVGSHQPQPRSVFNYSSVGTEANIHYELGRRLELEVYGGYNFGGNFYIKNQTGHNPLYTEIDGAPYGGATVDFGF